MEIYTTNKGRSSSLRGRSSNGNLHMGSSRDSSRSNKENGRQLTPSTMFSHHTDSTESVANLSELWSKAPFVMPSDDEVLRMRSKERKNSRDKKRKENLLPVAQKTTFTSRVNTMKWSQELKQYMADVEEKIAKEMKKMKSVTILPVEHFHKEKENLTEFVTKKREIFLAQMSLDNKRAEIRKLEDKIYLREQDIRRSEAMLEYDNLEFEAFLQKHEENVQEALRKSEIQSKLKQEKFQEAKKLNAVATALMRDVYKFNEQLDECRKYKDFLVGITPKDWFEDQNSEDNSPTTATNEEERMYFHSPNQLLEIFSSLEEKNLTLMEECQDSEILVDTLRGRLSALRGKNESRIGNLKSQLQNFKSLLRGVEESQSSLRNKRILNVVDRKCEYSSEEIIGKVAEVYARCGFDIDPTLNVIHMLTSIEARLEENVLLLEVIPDEYIEQTEKSNEKERRLKVRAERIEKVRLEQEKRAMRSLARANAPVHKRLGKPVMFRSRLPKKKKEKVVDSSDEDKQLVDFLSRAY